MKNYWLKNDLSRTTTKKEIKEMKALDQLKSSNPARLIPPYKKNERRLLSVVMSSLDIVPSFRAAILSKAGYGSGKTCQFIHIMEPEFNGINIPPGRPDGLLVCTRGKAQWSAFIEAKSDEHKIDSEQVFRYVELAKYFKIDVLLTISNELSLSPKELPYYIASNKRRGRILVHLSWLSIITEINLLLESGNLDHMESKVMLEVLSCLTDPSSGVQAFDQMPKGWPDFVSSANTSLGFNKSTVGVKDIVLAWQQERRDLLLKLIQKLGPGVSLAFRRNAKSDPKVREKEDLDQLVNAYILNAEYSFSKSSVRLEICADLKACMCKYTVTLKPPKGKQSRATVTWLLSILSDFEKSDLEITFDWPYTKDDRSCSLEELRANPELGSQHKRDAPDNVQLVVSTQNVRGFKSRKKFIEGLEKETIGIALLLKSKGLA
jgi:hypothetical protein